MMKQREKEGTNLRRHTGSMRFEILTAVKMSMLVFWVVTPCELVERYKRFEEHTASILCEAGQLCVTCTLKLSTYFSTTL
jgi:hypothetical protein